MHKFHTLQCKNNKLLLSNHQLLWCNIYTLWGSSSSVCDGEHFVLKIHKLLFDFVFRKYASCNHPLLKIFRPGQPYRLSACHLSMQHNHGLTRTFMSEKKNWCPKLHTINHVHQTWHQNTFEAQ
jgi:hypothetical protein